MKRIICIVLPFLILLGCKKTDRTLDKVLELREQTLKSKCISFDTKITADYGEELYVFSMRCETDEEGSLHFCVNEPVSISGITGVISVNGGSLTFDSEVLAFEMIADGQISPVAAPWVFLKTLRGGYIHAGSELDSGFFAEFQDSYDENALKVDISFDADAIPIFAEIYWNQRRIISLEIDNFVFV